MFLFFANWRIYLLLSSPFGIHLLLPNPPNILFTMKLPDLNPLNFYLWGLLKSLVYLYENNTVQMLTQRIKDAYEHIHQHP